MSTYLILPRKVKAVLAGKALSRKVAFELDLKGLARLNQAGEGKKEKKNSMRKGMEQESMRPIGGQEERGIAEMAGRWRGWRGSGNGAGPLGWTQPGQGLYSPLYAGAATGCSLREAKQASDSYGEDFRPISSQQRSIR